MADVWYCHHDVALLAQACTVLWEDDQPLVRKRSSPQLIAFFHIITPNVASFSKLG